MRVVQEQLFKWNWKKNIQTLHFLKRNIKVKIFEFEEELSLFETSIEKKTTLKNKSA